MVTCATAAVVFRYLVELIRNLGSASPSRRKVTAEPRSKPVPITWMSTVVSRAELSGTVAVTVTDVVAARAAAAGSVGASELWQPHTTRLLAAANRRMILWFTRLMA